jgi:multidrug efflux pump subunit AcrB
MYICVAALLAFLAFFAAGFSASHVSFGALIVAILLYVIPFIVAMRLVQERRA